MVEDVHKIGGIPAIMKYLLNHTDLIDGSQLTVTGKTIAENLQNVQELEFEHQSVIRKIEHALKPTGHLTVLKGNLAPGSAIAKITGKEGTRFEVELKTTTVLCSHSPSSRVTPGYLTSTFPLEFL